MDVESLEKSARRRGSRLDVFLVVSVMFLLVAVTAVAAGGAIVVMDLRSKLESPRQAIDPSSPGRQSGDESYPQHKMENFAYLEFLQSDLKTRTVHLEPIPYLNRDSLGSSFSFNKVHHSLSLQRPGMYFMYVDLNLTCINECSSGPLTVQVGDKLTCTVELPAINDSTVVSRKCWTVTQLGKEDLVTHMTVSEEVGENWSLQRRGSGIGMFLVD